MDISLKLINDLTSAEAVSRGRAYFHDGRVNLETISDTFVRAVVYGSDDYVVELHSDNKGIDSSCTCPFQWGGKCKHIVAAMFATLYNNAKLVDQSQQPRSDEREGRTTTWVQDVRRLLHPMEQESSREKSDPSWRLVYSLKLVNARRYLYPVRMKITKDGLDGQSSLLRKFDLFGDSHFDFIDRIVVERISEEFYNVVPLHPGDSAHELTDDHSEWGTTAKIKGDMLSILGGKDLFLALQ